MANTISSFKALAVFFVLAVFSAVAASARDSEMVLALAHRKKSLELSSGQVRSEKMKEAALVAIAAAIGNFLQDIEVMGILFGGRKSQILKDSMKVLIKKR
ncbi:hypothetical protein RHGRI_000942 [Rhododendron griersonianum]|uniref:Uncharacterized protein n=1 Tax=Rhododendron griersonianum TaxID=479676 RepID=A0AAV6LIG7_9ERIC|nr:hypothetical protein RHGRI_000942 [Rhododendron griersonianum]